MAVAVAAAMLQMLFYSNATSRKVEPVCVCLFLSQTALGSLHQLPVTVSVWLNRNITAPTFYYN